MRKEGSLFGGEVSGHYYFRDFYCADSGTIPALLVLELLAREGKSMSELLAPYHERYFISGEINSEVADPRRRRSRRSPSATPTPSRNDSTASRSTTRTGTSTCAPSNTEPLLRLCLESLVSHEDMEQAPRRGARADPLVGDDPVVSDLIVSDEAEQREREQLAQAAEAGIHRLAIPTPFQVGRVNAYLIEDSPLTLIDSGPNSAKALDELEQALAALGHKVEDIELLVVTHQHIDHFGLASILARRSGAEVAALDALAPFLAELRPARPTSTTRSRENLMLRHGIPSDVVTALRAVSASFRGWGASVEVTPPARARWLELRAARPHAARAAPPRPQPFGHGLPRRVSGRSCSRRTT